MAAQVAETTRRAGAQDLDEAQIRKLVTDVIEAWNEHDARAYSRLYADDADLTTVIGTTAHGREAIHAHIAEVFKTLFKKSHITAKTIWVRFLNPEIAVVDIRWQMIGALDWDGNILPTRQGSAELDRHQAAGRRVARHGNAQSGVDAAAVLMERAAILLLRR